jgi:hypothetical protein
MQITSKLLLSSAENILKDRKQENRGPVQADPGERALRSGTPVDSLSQTAVENRILNLQQNLSRVQRELSREQTRHSYLVNTPGEIRDDLTFDGAPLFPELQSGLDVNNIRESVARQIENSLHTLKTMQVEMENLHALQSTSSHEVDFTPSGLIRKEAIRNISPDRVAKLTRP